MGSETSTSLRCKLLKKRFEEIIYERKGISDLTRLSNENVGSADVEVGTLMARDVIGLLLTCGTAW